MSKLTKNEVSKEFKNLYQIEFKKHLEISILEKLDILQAYYENFKESLELFTIKEVDNDFKDIAIHPIVIPTTFYKSYNEKTMDFEYSISYNISKIQITEKEIINLVKMKRIGAMNISFADKIFSSLKIQKSKNTMNVSIDPNPIDVIFFRKLDELTKK